jgi:hypothetical protein
MNSVQERLTAGAVSPFIAQDMPADLLSTGPGSPIARIGSDAVALLRRPENAIAPGFIGGGAMGIVSQLMNVLQQLLGMLGWGTGGSQPQTGPQTYFSSATASSTGDPHLAFDGTDAHGAAVQARFDSMASHNNLLDSASFAGGYRVATRATQPGANGITYNRDAAIFTNFGRTRVTLDNAGNATVNDNGETQSLAAGQSLDLGDGERVTRNADGSMEVLDQNALGGSIVTRLSENGAGVDVNVQSRNVDLGGDLLRRVAPSR